MFVHGEMALLHGMNQFLYQSFMPVNSMLEGVMQSWLHNATSAGYRIRRLRCVTLTSRIGSFNGASAPLLREPNKACMQTT